MGPIPPASNGFPDSARLCACRLWAGGWFADRGALATVTVGTVASLGLSARGAVRELTGDKGLDLSTSDVGP